MALPLSSLFPDLSFSIASACRSLLKSLILIAFRLYDVV